MWLRKIRYLTELLRNQWLKPSELAKIQQKRLRAIIKHAYSNIEFYHRKFKLAGVKPEDIKTIKDLPKIPVTKRSEVKEGFLTGKIFKKTLDFSKCHYAKTAGSSGEPVTVLLDEKAEDFQKAVAVRSFMEAGGRFHDKWAMITSPQRMLLKKRWFQRFGLLSPVYLSVFDSPERHVAVLNRLKPDVIEGYASCVWLLARTIAKEGIDSIQPRVIISSAEVLSEKARKFINSVFSLEMFDQFGCVEIGRSAWECEEHHGYHMDSDALAMEFVDDGEHVAFGERGHLLYTSLFNYAMPLIRYDVGDICVPTDEQCPCGRGLPLIKRIEGRAFDFIVTPSGKVFSGGLLMIIMREIPGVAQYKVVQETKDKFSVWIVKDPHSFSSDPISQVQEQIKKHLGDVKVDVEVVEDIPKDKSGKHRWIVSKVKLK